MKIKLKDLTEEQYERWKKENCRNGKCDSCLFFRVECNMTPPSCWVKNKELYSNKFLNQEIEIKDELLLTNKEREYLENVLKPFKDKVKSVEKMCIAAVDESERACICITMSDGKNILTFSLPYFVASKYYNGLRSNKKYTLEDLRLFQERKYKITLSEFWNSKEMLAIHCDTEEKANKFIKESNKTNKWGDFGNYYEDYKEKTCYSNDSDYYDLNSYKEDNYTIYEFDEVDLEN